jgi:Uncharacterized Fe-S center protein
MADIIPGTGGDVYVPYSERNGDASVIFFTRDLSPAGLKKIYDRVSLGIEGRVAVKLHTGEAEGPNIIPRPWVRELLEEKLPEATIVETNAYYDGTRTTTEDHKKTLEINGWTFCPVDILDENGTATLPVSGGKWIDEIHVGANLLNYDSILTLTHFKGHIRGGFGGSNKNIGIGCADGKIGKAQIHTPEGYTSKFELGKEEFMERMTESTKATVDRFAGHISYINVMRNMSVSCDCEGCSAEPVVTPDIGIFAGYDILAVDNACIDVIYNLPLGGGDALIERIESRHGLRQLSYMKELGMGNDLYSIIDIDNDDNIITIADIVENVEPIWTPDIFNTFPGRNKIR